MTPEPATPSPPLTVDVDDPRTWTWVHPSAVQPHPAFPDMHRAYRQRGSRQIEAPCLDCEAAGRNCVVVAVGSAAPSSSGVQDPSVAPDGGPWRVARDQVINYAAGTLDNSADRFEEADCHETAWMQRSAAALLRGLLLAAAPVAATPAASGEAQDPDDDEPSRWAITQRFESLGSGQRIAALQRLGLSDLTRRHYPPHVLLAEAVAEIEHAGLGSMFMSIAGEIDPPAATPVAPADSRGEAQDPPEADPFAAVKALPDKVRLAEHRYATGYQAAISDVLNLLTAATPAGGEGTDR